VCATPIIATAATAMPKSTLFIVSSGFSFVEL
jgi:hypothetical protein